MMRLGFYYHIPAQKIDEKIYLPGYLGLFLDSLAAQCDELILFLHLPDIVESHQLDYPIQSRNVTLVSLEPRGSASKRLLFSNSFTKIIQKCPERLDVFLIRGPSPLLPALATAIGNTPIVLLIVGDYLAGVDSTPQPRWRKELIRLWSRYYAWLQQKAVKKSLVFVNSKLLYRQMAGKAKRLVETRTTTLTQDDFFIRGAWILLKGCWIWLLP
jgi:hypothetical protein